MASRRFLVPLALAAAPVAAQVPAHATQLNPQTSQLRPTFVQNGDVVHAFAFGYPTIYHARSVDGGRTWPILEQALGAFGTNNVSAGFHEHEVAIAQHAGGLLVASHDLTLGPRVTRSLDGGLTWQPPANLAASVTPQFDSMRTRLFANGPNVVVAWWNQRPNGRVFCNRSTDFGGTWQPTETLLDIGMPPGAPGLQRLLVSGSGANVDVVWHDGTTRHQRSTDGGATWLPAPVGLPGAPAFQSTVPKHLCAFAASRLLHTGNDVLHSSDSGTTWSQVTTHSIPIVLDLAMEGSLAVAVGRDNNLTNTLYIVNVSTDAGASWQATPLQLGAASPTNIFAHAHVDHGVVYVQWELSNYPGNVIRSDDAGATWQVIDGPVQAGFSPGPVRAIHTALTWTSNNHYHAYVGIGSSRLGQGAAGSGGVMPNLTTAALPVRGRSTTIHASGLLGGAPSGLGFSFQPPTALPFVGGTVFLASLDVLLPFLTSGNAGQPGVGTFAATLAIPNTPALSGSRIVLQGIAIDAGAFAGLSLTNGLELWLR